MPDYKKMYLRMFHAAEDAINLLVQAQQDCEEMYLNAEAAQEEPDSRVITIPLKQEEG